ncbi:hypothetical protein [Streptomyces sp. NPDC059008]|uniref:hypothetical protein n=1 Tax=Streptomyces sp. NPDC059008 TaxID=3346693 RepID=UPI0036A36CA5
MLNPHTIGTAAAIAGAQITAAVIGAKASTKGKYGKIARAALIATAVATPAVILAAERRRLERATYAAKVDGYRIAAEHARQGILYR